MDTDSDITSTAERARRPPAGRRPFWRVFVITYAAFLLMIAIAAASIGYWGREHVKHALQVEITRNLTQKAQIVANRINSDRAHDIDVIASQEGLAAGARATVIDTNGAVVADSEVPVASLRNEGRQPEFAAALRGSVGVETRSRNSAQVLFVAVPVAGGAVRLAYPLSDLEVISGQLNRRILAGCAGSALVGLLLAAAIAHSAST